MLKHKFKWVKYFLEQHSRIDKFNQLWAMMAQFPGIAQFNRPYSQMTQWSGNDMKAPRHMIGAVNVATVSYSLVSRMIPSTEVQLCVNSSVHLQIMAQYLYHIEIAIEYMGKYMEKFHHQKDVFSRFRISESTKLVLRAWKKQRTLDKQYKWESDPTRNNLSVVVMRDRVDEDKIQIVSDIAQHPIN